MAWARMRLISSAQFRIASPRNGALTSRRGIDAGREQRPSHRYCRRRPPPALSMMKGLTAMLRPRDRSNRRSPSKAAVSGSGPSLASSSWPAGHDSTAARRNAVGRCSATPGPTPARCRHARAWPASVPTGTRRRLPDMPRWPISVPPSAWISRYLARRSTALDALAGQAHIEVLGDRPAQAALAHHHAGDALPPRDGAMPRRAVSTSGSSGMQRLGTTVSRPPTPAGRRRAGISPAPARESTRAGSRSRIRTGPHTQHQGLDTFPLVVAFLVAQHPVVEQMCSAILRIAISVFSGHHGRYRPRTATAHWVVGDGLAQVQGRFQDGR